jgi:hypothetical protein
LKCRIAQPESGIISCVWALDTSALGSAAVIKCIGSPGLVTKCKNGSASSPSSARTRFDPIFCKLPRRDSQAMFLRIHSKVESTLPSIVMSSQEYKRSSAESKRLYRSASEGMFTSLEGLRYGRQYRLRTKICYSRVKRDRILQKLS